MGLRELCREKPTRDPKFKISTNTYRRNSVIPDSDFVNFEKACKLIVPVLIRNHDGKFNIGWTLTKPAKTKLELIKGGRIQ